MATLRKRDASQDGSSRAESRSDRVFDHAPDRRGAHRRSRHAADTTAGIGLVPFILALTGLSCCVAGLYHIPRYHQTQGLETEKERLEALIARVHTERRDYERLQQAITEERHFREGVLRRVTGQHRSPRLTISEWLRREALLDSERQGRVPGQEAPDS